MPLSAGDGIRGGNAVDPPAVVHTVHGRHGEVLGARGEVGEIDAERVEQGEDRDAARHDEHLGSGLRHLVQRLGRPPGHVGGGLGERIHLGERVEGLHEGVVGRHVVRHELEERGRPGGLELAEAQLAPAGIGLRLQVGSGRREQPCRGLAMADAVARERRVEPDPGLREVMAALGGLDASELGERRVGPALHPLRRVQHALPVPHHPDPRHAFSLGRGPTPVAGWGTPEPRVQVALSALPGPVLEQKMRPERKWGSGDAGSRPGGRPAPPAAVRSGRPAGGSRPA
ncbi:hypothetical protein MICRO8M_60088 [Microbacterium sp. 8M]|nr:hypothetical protein MICRO8M_60088 [Microbacterium sp. 8M]